MAGENTGGIITWGGPAERDRRRAFLNLLRNCPIPDDEVFLNLGLFLTPQTMSRVLFMDFLYRQILPVQGIAVEFGCRWGQTLSLFAALRGIYEPFNRLRKIVGFDTFAGLPAVCEKDGPLAAGMYGVPQGYAEYLEQVLAFQEGESPLAHLKKFELVQGDASVECVEYLKRNPHTIIALAYFDLDIYQPTRDCLRAIRDHLTQGSVLAFDELNEQACPGETCALKEVFGLSRYALRRWPHSARTSYLVIDRPLEQP